MIIQGYGIQLYRLQAKDIELVRFHRNSDLIKSKMRYQKEISIEEQIHWFEGINNRYNNYFIIQVNKKKIGLINGANIDWGNGVTNSGGIFVWDTEFYNSKEIVGASLLLTDTSVLLNLRKTKIVVLNSNKNAISFNKKLGYKLVNETEKYSEFELDMNDYILRRDELIKAIYPTFLKTKRKIIFDYTLLPSEIIAFYLERIETSQLNEFEIEEING